jgi:outer membrane protein assembly factor BamB
MTDWDVIVAATERSLYAIDAQTGETLWRRRARNLDERDVAPVPGTDLILLSYAEKDRARMEALDLLSGESVWRSERLRGQVMQMAVDLNQRLLAVVVVRKTKERPREGFKQRPTVHLLDLQTGEERWRRELGSEIEMLPARWTENEETVYTLDNYRAPLFLDGRLYLFYDGVTAYDASTGKELLRERFRVNEEGLALTEADPVFDERLLYVSGRGRVRAISRTTGKVVWETKDLGTTPEIIVTDGVLFVRTGGTFARVRDGAAIARGPYGVSAIDKETGRTLWQYKGADRGITNIVLSDPATVVVADRDDLIALDAATGKRLAKVPHGIEDAAFALLNERGHVLVGGKNEIAAFDPRSGQAIWRARYTPPGRGLLRTVAAIAARAVSFYFRYGALFSFAYRGAQFARAASALRWSGLHARADLTDLTSLVTDAARERASSRLALFGRAASLRGGDSRTIFERAGDADLQDRLLDRLDPTRQFERLANFLRRRERLVALRVGWIYFYTQMRERGLVGVNINTGRAERFVVMSKVDPRFIVNEADGSIIIADDDKLIAKSYALL